MRRSATGSFLSRSSAATELMLDLPETGSGKLFEFLIPYSFVEQAAPKKSAPTSNNPYGFAAPAESAPHQRPRSRAKVLRLAPCPTTRSRIAC